mgnify:CR=1 FL=1
MRLEAENIAVSIAGKSIVKNVTLDVPEHKFSALLGANGSGKTTLLRAIYKTQKTDSGTVRLDGEDIARFSGKKIARRMAVMGQFNQINFDYTVMDIALMGRYPFHTLLDREKDRDYEAALEALSKVGMKDYRDRNFQSLSGGEKQRVVLARALTQNPKVLILDEPTASLTPQEIDELMEIIRSLTAAGKSILLITHKLKEIKASSDHCMIIRRGKYIDTVKVSEHTEDELASLMVGRKVSLRAEKEERNPGETVLFVKELRARDYRGAEILKGLSLSIRGGEILGLAGIDGNGQSQLVEILTGLSKAESGEVRMGGENILNHTPRDTFLKGVSSIPEDRQKHGLVLDFTVAENLILQNFGQRPYSHRGILNKGAIRKHAAELIERFDIRPSGCEERPAGQLSGGNQQKVIIAREVTNEKELLIAFNPTRGLDVGAIEFVHSYLLGQRNKGRAILLVSFELEEIMGLSDRIAVIFDGRIAGEMPGKDADEYQLGLLMAGGKAE